MKTNTVSNTAFRGFGGPQGMMVVERAIDEIAWTLGLDPLDVRKRNLYGEGRDVTPYGMVVEDNILPELIDRCEIASDYRRRRRAGRRSSTRRAPTLKRGIALTPVKFGISFTTTHLNQAGALVHVYQDGSIHLNHGGTEMGQGLYIKVAQVVAEEFGVEAERVKITATTTAKVPNTSATAASSGSDINGMAAKNAAGAIKERLIAFAAESYRRRGRPDRVPRQPRVHRQPVGAVRRADPARPISRACRCPRPASTRRRRSTGTPKTGQGRPFYYFSYGAACSEVLVDITHRRDEGDARRYRPRRRALAQSGGRHRPDRGRLRAGHGLAHHRGACVPRGRAAAQPRALDLQDPVRVGRAGALQDHAVGRRQPRGHDLSLQGGRRAAADAGDLGVRGDRRRDPQPQARRARAARCAGDAGSDPARRAGGAPEAA